MTTFTVDNVEATTLGKIFNYHEIAIDKTSANQKKDYPFYGVPSEVIHPDLFIDLPDFTEISRELLPGVKFRAYNRIPTMQILNPATQNYFTDQPLVLLNGIPVQDLNVIKNLSSKDIDRIELCRSERFYGNLSFQGVVAIYSAKKDYKQSSADDLVNLNMDAVQPDASVNAPGELSPNEPDLRKILLWKPNIRPDQTISIDFRTSDLKGNYVLIVRGRTRNGTLVLCEQNFEVN